MNTEIVSMDEIVMDVVPEKSQNLIHIIPDSGSSEKSLPAFRRFGITDLWSIRNMRKQFIYYRK